MNKNAYEIRLDLLTMAREDLLQRFFQTLESFRSVTGEVDRGAFLEAQLDVIEKNFPTTEDIVARAEELYSFVSNNTNKE